VLLLQHFCLSTYISNCSKSELSVSF